MGIQETFKLEPLNIQPPIRYHYVGTAFVFTS